MDCFYRDARSAQRARGSCRAGRDRVKALIHSHVSLPSFQSLEIANYAPNAHPFQGVSNDDSFIQNVCIVHRSACEDLGSSCSYRESHLPLFGTVWSRIDILRKLCVLISRQYS